MSRKHRSGSMKPHSSSNSREQKRAQFTTPARKKNNTAVALTVIAAVLLAIIVYVIVGDFDGRPAATPIPSLPSARNTAASPEGDILIPISDISGKARFFDFTASDNRRVRFFIMKSSDGAYRAALDACDVCYEAKKGYYQEGNDMICRKCGRQFPSELINEVSGGCNPVGLPLMAEGDAIRIKAREIESRRSYF
ncbi:MAG: DUF2318 domain-containing protein [Acidobacteriota bacterium]